MEQQENTPGSRQDTHVFHASGTETGGVAGAATGPGGVAGVGAAEGAAGGDSGCADEFTGMLSLQNLDTLDHTAAAHILQRLDALASWTAAQKARTLNRYAHLMNTVLNPRLNQGMNEGDTGVDAGMLFSLTTTETATLLRIPEPTAGRLLIEAQALCALEPTLAALETGTITYAHARTITDQLQHVPAPDTPALEAELLTAAATDTNARFTRTAARLRARRHPHTIPARHQDAVQARRVCLDPAPDGMCWLSAFLQAPTATAIHTALSTAARGEKASGDPRTLDQLRADILESLLTTTPVPATGPGTEPRSVDMDGEGDGDGSADIGQNSGDRDGTRTGTHTETTAKATTPGKARLARTETRPGPVPEGRISLHTELMILISADTLTGTGNEPAELTGYGPISPDTARRLAATATHCTGLLTHPETGAILAVGRRRHIPTGLKHWLQARDGTCRFPGCSTNTHRTEIDHTRDWAKNGPTEHSNLANLCPKHHRYKTLGHWKATQPEPGILEWTSPTGRTYRTEPQLHLQPRGEWSERARQRKGEADRPDRRPNGPR